MESSDNFNSKTYDYLNDKEKTVGSVTLGTATISVVLAMAPGDITTLIANQFARLSSYLIIVVGAIFLEKVLLSITGYITISLLVPIACLLFGIYVFIKSDILRNLAIKLLVFGLIIFMIIPVSVKVSSIIENQNIYQSYIDQASNTQISEKDILGDNDEESNSEDQNWIDKINIKVKNAVTDSKDTLNDLCDRC